MLWEVLGLHDLFKLELPWRGTDVLWAPTAGVTTIALFVEPDGELHIEDTWHAPTALHGLVGSGRGGQ